LVCFTEKNLATLFLKPKPVSELGNENSKLGCFVTMKSFQISYKTRQIKPICIAEFGSRLLFTENVGLRARIECILPRRIKEK
jgi:hypothetical protein